jgi:hypothetical protein
MEIFTKSSSEVKRPSKWETTIYIAIQSNYINKVSAIKRVDENIEESEIVPQQ